MGNAAANGTRALKSADDVENFIVKAMKAWYGDRGQIQFKDYFVCVAMILIIPSKIYLKWRISFPPRYFARFVCGQPSPEPHPRIVEEHDAIRSSKPCALIGRNAITYRVVASWNWGLAVSITVSIVRTYFLSVQ
nr:hypothetical protein CFP56_44473 [Quercus suber]